MNMEDEMANHVQFTTTVSVGGCPRPLPVDMYTDEHSENCSIRFGDSFTLNVDYPSYLIDFAQELEQFAIRAYEFQEKHRSVLRSQTYQPYPDKDFWEMRANAGFKSVQSDTIPVDAADDFVQAGIDAREQQKASRMMKGTVSAPEWNPNDPLNW